MPLGSGSSGLRPVGVRVPPWALLVSCSVQERSDRQEAESRRSRFVLHGQRSNIHLTFGAGPLVNRALRLLSGGLLFVHERTHDGRALRLLTIVDEYTRECLAIDVARRLNSENVLERLAELFVNRGVADHIRSDNGPEFTSRAVREWLERIGVRTLLIEPGSPWENGYVESFNGKLRDELLSGEIFYTLKEAEAWCKAGGANTTRCDPIAHWVISRLRRKRRCCSRLRFASPAPTISCQHRFYELRSGPNTWGRSLVDGRRRAVSPPSSRRLVGLLLT